MPKVYVAACGDYEQHNVSAAIQKGIEALGGMDSLLGSSVNIAVKPNLLKANKPEDCVTTHPAIVRAVLEAVTGSGRKAEVVECPSGPFTAASLKTIYKETGIREAAQVAGASLNFDLGHEAVMLSGPLVSELSIANAIRRADAVISAAKLKTHAMMTYTGAVKNLFGVVPGLSKGECHLMLPRRENFAELIVDIAEIVKPAISVIDGVWGMEGDGPSAGEPRKIGAVIISDSPYAADIVAGRIIGLDWRENPIIKCAYDRGLIDPDNIETLGDDTDALRVDDFAKPKQYNVSILRGKMPYFLEKILDRKLAIYPEFDKKTCTGCATCLKCCPAGALAMKNKLPVLDKKKCINCFCCHELCPKKAVGLYRPLMLRAFSKILKKNQ